MGEEDPYGPHQEVHGQNSQEEKMKGRINPPMIL
jgi:hypothetical protein